jgi:hypothetical protein
MGQYHKLICAETRTWADCYPLGAGLKAYEQVYNPTATPSALAFMCACNSGTHERDIPWAPHGTWAGKTPIMVGDYAQNGDLVGRSLPAPEDEMYGRAHEKPAISTFVSKSANYLSVSASLIPVLERVHNHRCLGLHADGSTDGKHIGWANFIPVKVDASTDEGWAIDLSSVAPDDVKEVYDYYCRIGIETRPSWKRRAMDMPLYGHQNQPKSAAPEVIAPASEGEGEHLLWVNLDRCEYIDPKAMGDVPDLVGIMQGSSAGAVLSMLVHENMRGSGDVDSSGSLTIAGRWRGDRIALIGAEGIKVRGLPHVTQASVRASFMDISMNAQTVFDPDAVFGVEAICEEDRGAEIKTGPGAIGKIERAIFNTAMMSKSMAKIKSKECDIVRTLHAVFVPPLKIVENGKGEALDEPIHIAPRFDLYASDGKVWLDHAARSAILKDLKTLPEETLTLTKGDKDDRLYAPCSHTTIVDLSDASNHALVRLTSAPA